MHLRSIRAEAFMAVALAALLVSPSVLAVACYQACGVSVVPLGQFQPASNTRIQEELRRIHQQTASLPQRVEAVSELFLGAPYKHGALGEGPDGEFDRDPLIRFDAFDCTTFVETVMALSLDSDLNSAMRTLQKIRYKDGQIGYATRNHFIELDWVPNNVGQAICATSPPTSQAETPSRSTRRSRRGNGTSANLRPVLRARSPRTRNSV